MSLQSMKKVATQTLPEICKIVKQRNGEFVFNNKFKDSNCIDPVRLLFSEYKYLTQNNSIYNDTRELLEGLHIEQLETESSREVKRKILLEIAQELEKIIKRHHRVDPKYVISRSKGFGTEQEKAICTLYLRI